MFPQDAEYWAAVRDRELALMDSKKVFVSIDVDDLNARDSYFRSGGYGGYDFTREEISMLLDLIAKKREEHRWVPSKLETV